MPLADKHWSQVTPEEMTAAYLRAERTAVTDSKLQILLNNALEASEFYHPYWNTIRSTLLHGIRGPLLAQVPTDTTWYKVSRLTDDDLQELRVIGRCGWDDPQDQNELAKVAARRPAALPSNPETWPAPPILWGHDKAGPFTILEGNRRLVAYAATSPPPATAIDIIIGLSPTPCYWHLQDSVPLRVPA